MTVRLVDSKEHMLSPNDIFIAAAHEDKETQEKLIPAAKKAKVTKERMTYSYFLQEYSNKGLVRIRAGNTLFTIAALKGRMGFVRTFNGDTPANFVENMGEFLKSARAMGFDFLFALTHSSDMVRILKVAVRKIKSPGLKTRFDSKHGIFAIVTGEKRAI